MDRDELQTVLELQQQAYELLMWLDKRAAWSDETVQALRFGDECEAWVRRSMGGWPTTLRPPAESVHLFARLLSSFFSTSFRVETANVPVRGDHGEWYGGGKRPRLVAGSPSGKPSRHTKERERESMRHLQEIALTALAQEAEIDTTGPSLARLADNSAIAPDVSVWAYACELHRRAHFASQGTAVHALWRAMDPATREKLTAERVWDSRERLIFALKHAPKPGA